MWSHIRPEGNKRAAFNPFMEQHFFQYIHLAASLRPEQNAKLIKDTLEVDKIYFKLGSNLHIFKESTDFPYIPLYRRYVYVLLIHYG